MKLQKINDIIHLIWEYDIKKKAFNKNDKEYCEYRVTVPQLLVEYKKLQTISFNDQTVVIRGGRITIPSSVMKKHHYKKIRYDFDTKTDEIIITFQGENKNDEKTK